FKIASTSRALASWNDKSMWPTRIALFVVLSIILLPCCFFIRRFGDRKGLASFPRRDGWRAVEPVLALRCEEVDVDRIFRTDELVRRVRRDHENRTGRHHKLLALRVDLAAPFGDPGDLFVGMMVQREFSTFLHRPFDEGRLRAAQILALNQR